MSDDPVLRFRLVLPLTPIGKARARAGAGGHHYTPAKTRDYENAIRAAAKVKQGDDDVLDGPLHMTVTAFLPLPASAKKPRKFHTQKPDLDNIVKAAKDALNPEWKKILGVRTLIWRGIYRDDCQVVRCLSSKHWADDGQLSISIWSVT